MLKDCGENARSGELHVELDRFWELVTTRAEGEPRVDHCDNKYYRRLHGYITRTLEGGMNDEERDECARMDWAEDCERYGRSLCAPPIPSPRHGPLCACAGPRCVSNTGNDGRACACVVST